MRRLELENVVRLFTFARASGKQAVRPGDVVRLVVLCVQQGVGVEGEDRGPIDVEAASGTDAVRKAVASGGSVR